MSKKSKPVKSLSAAPAASKEPLIYVGPTIVGIAVSNTIYSGEVSKSLSKAMEQNPLFKYFVVKISESGKARNEIRTAGTALNLFYNILANK